MTDEAFALIMPLLPPAERGGRQRTTSLREVLNALLHLLRTGCPPRGLSAAPALRTGSTVSDGRWYMPPNDFPPKSTLYGYFRRFWQEGVWSVIRTALLMAAREQAGREASPTAAIVDSRSVETTAVDLGPNVVVDRELITGQNPRSAHPIAEALIEALDARPAA